MPTSAHIATPGPRTRIFHDDACLSVFVSRVCLCVLCLFASLPFCGRALAAGALETAAAAPFLVGSISVTALLDRQNTMDISLFNGPATPEMRQKYMPGGKAPASVNSFLIQSGGKNILVDTGFGTLRPDASELAKHLSARGLSLDDIDLVLLTHMHSDHIGGLLKNKKRALPKARIMVSKPELEYWLGLAETNGTNDNAALVKVVVREYGQDILPPFALGASLLPGISSVDASGHTPGHSVFLVESEGKSLLMLGDLLHAAALQFPLPDECAVYDMDAQMAAKARRGILSMAAIKEIPVAGAHIPFPGMGGVKIVGAGFAFSPLLNLP